MTATIGRPQKDRYWFAPYFTQSSRSAGRIMDRERELCREVSPADAEVIIAALRMRELSVEAALRRVEFRAGEEL